MSRCSDLSQQSPPQSHGLGCQAAPLIVIQPKPSATKLLSKDSVLFAKVVNSVLLRLIHPSGHSDQHEPKWVEDSWRQQSPLSRPWSGDASDPALAIRSIFWTLRDLSSYEEVKAKALEIYARLEDGSMPCDEAWPEERLELFKQWMDEGSAP